MKIDKLIEQTNALTGPDQETDAAIHRMLAGGAKDHWYDFHGVWTTDSTTPPITASLDAAVALVERVLPGWDFELTRIKCHGAICVMWPEANKEGGIHREAPMLPLALILALLSALKAKEARDGR